MIKPTTTSGALLSTNAATVNLALNRIEQSTALRSSCETIIEYNMNEYGETPSETVQVANYDLDSAVAITGVTVMGDNTIVYTAPGNTFKEGDTVSIIGVNPNVFNLTNAVVIYYVGAVQGSTFAVSSAATGTYVSGGLVAKKQDYYPVTGTKGLPFKKLFPLDTVIKTFRPESSGIKYAIVGDLNRIVYSPTAQSDSWSDPKDFEYGTRMVPKHRVYYPGPETVYKYWVGGRGKGIDLRLSYPKTILTNKIVIKFEIGHSVPATFKVYLSNSTTPIFEGTSSHINVLPPPYGNSGEVVLYYSPGSSATGWTTSETWSKSTPVSTNAVRVTATKETGSTDKFIGIIEVSPRWEKHFFNEITSLTVTRDSSSGSEEYLPVSRISANSISMSLFTAVPPGAEYFVTYDKSLTLNSNITYLSKNMIIRPYIIINPLNQYETLIAKQGTYYLDSWSVSEFGEIDLQARDGAKILQETISYPMLCERYTSTAIIRRLLDSIGFTNYNINYRKISGSTNVNTTTGSTEDDSVITPTYWWTNSDKTVWDALSEICRDSQMSAFFDEDNILQFYTRDAFFDAARKKDVGDSTSVIWEFRNSPESNTSFTITNATTNYENVNNKVLTYTANNTLNQGDLVTITGVVPSTSHYNLQNAVVASANATTFSINGGTWSVGDVQKSVYTSGGLATKSPNLPNIISLNKQEFRSTGNIKILYTTAYTNNHSLDQMDQPLWEQQGERYLGAGSLRKDLLYSQTTGFIELNPVKTSSPLSSVSVPIYNFSGYLVIGSEIIEFDGVEYEYSSLGTDPTAKQKVKAVVKNLGELQQIISLAEPGENFIIPTGRYQIKSRGAFGTEPQNHYADTINILADWNVINENGSVKISGLMNLALLPPAANEQIVSRNVVNAVTLWNLEEIKQGMSTLEDYKAQAAKNPDTVFGSEEFVDNKKISNSVFTIYNKSTNPKGRNMVAKQANFDIDYYENFSDYGNKIDYEYFAFGAKMFFTPWKESTKAPEGGIGFFLNSAGTSGYGILVSSTEKNSVEKDKEKNTDIRIIKFDGANSFTVLPDSQTDLSKSISNIGYAEEYYIDVKVDRSGTATIITAYINGKPVVAVDSSPLPVSKYIGMFTNKGECNFDYFYAYPLQSKEAYDTLEGNSLIYGKTPFSSMSEIYGNKVINNNSLTTKGFYEEFGPVAKEMIYLQSKFEGNPGYATYLSTGINPFVQVLSEKSNNFELKGYIINNSSAPVPISDTSQGIQLMVIGRQVVVGENRELVSGEKYVNDEPVIVESSWIQNESDAQRLANWLGLQWKDNNLVVYLEVFGNPFISVGDIVSIEYPRSGISNTTKFLVTRVEQRYDGGLQTSLECRSITVLDYGI